MRLFISYARIDKPYCVQIIETLDVHDVWYDQRMYAGQNWWQEILRRLNWCEGLIYLVSPESLASEYCRKEYDLARDLGRKIFLVIIRENTIVPDHLAEFPVINLSKGLTPEGVRLLLSAIHLAERQQVPKADVSTIAAEQVKQPTIEPSTVIKSAVTAMENGLFDEAVFLLRQAKNSGFKSRFINIDIILKDAESALSRQSHQLEAAREYRQISALLKHKSTAHLGWEAFQAFQKDFPDFDPDGLAARSPDKTASQLPQSEPPTSFAPASPPHAPPVAISAAPDLSLPRESSPRARIGSTASTVQFSAYHPKEVAPGDWQPLFAYVFQQAAADLVSEDADWHIGERPQDFRAVARPSLLPLQEGALVTATPHLPGFEFNPPDARIRFYKDWHRFDFELRARQSPPNQSANGRITFMVEGIIIADIPLSIFVVEKAQEGSALSSITAQPYQSIFCSYSHQDTQIVERAERFYKALGNDFLRDVISLKSGQSWGNELMSLIDRADVFQLFWSQAASQSSHVRKEWEHALIVTSSRENFIRPVYWQEPKPTIPPQLKHIHFDYQPDLLK